MKVLIHFPNSYSPPVGIWWETADGSVESYYPEPDSWPAKTGRWSVLAKSNPECSWEQWFDQIARRSGWPSVWETATTSSDPRDVFEDFHDDAVRLLSA